MWHLFGKRSSARLQTAGFTIIEVLFAVAVFGTLAASMLQFVAGPLQTGAGSADREKAVFLADEGLEAVRAIRNDGWSALTNGDHGITNPSAWQFSGTSDSTLDGALTYVRTITISDVSRDGSDNIVTTGGTIDPRTKKVVSLVAWTTRLGFPNATSTSAYLMQSSTSFDWLQTTDTHFNAGTKNSVTVTGTGVSGQIELSPAVKSWAPANGTLVTHSSAYDWLDSIYSAPFIDDTPGEFNAGTYTTNTQYDAGNAWVELTAGGMTAGNGTFTSRVYDAGTIGVWDAMSWVTTRPTGKSLPAFRGVETGYSAGNVDMSNNIVLYRFDEGASATAFTDASSNGYNASCTTCPTTGITGKLNNGVSFNGTTQVITSSTDFNQWLSRTASLSFWLKTSQVGNDTMWNAPGITGVEHTGDGDDIFWGWIDATGHIGIQAGDVAGAKSVVAINDNVWHNVVLTRDLNTALVKVYVDGVFQASATSDVGVKNFTFSDIGRINDTGGVADYYAGQLDEFAIFAGVVMTDQQALDIYRRGAMQLKFQVRSCDDAACSGEAFMGPDGTAATYYSELANTVASLPALALTNVPNNRYMQYQTTYTTDNALYTPEHVSATFDGNGFGTSLFSGTTVSGSGSNASIVEAGSLTWATFTQAQTWSETSDTDYNDGTFASTIVADTGDLGAVSLDTALDWATFASPTALQLNAISMVSATDGWGVGNTGTIVHWNGTSWSVVTSPTVQNLTAVNCRTASDCHAAASAGQLIRWNGTVWSNVIDTGAQIFAGIKVVSASDAWAVANSGQIYRWNGTTWTLNIDLGNHVFKAIDCTSATSCWASADSGRIARWNGTAWAQFVDTGAQLWNGLVMVDANNGWVVGSGTAAGAATSNIYRWNGAAWVAQTSNTATTLNAVHALSTSLVFAVGLTGRINKWNGTAWAVQTTPTANSLLGIKLTSSTSAFAVGAAGTIINYGTHYLVSGTYISSVFDAGSSATWGQIAWDENLPAGTNLTIATRTGPNPTCCTGWSAFSAEQTAPTGGAIVSPANRYIQYRATVTTTAATRYVTPRLNSIIVGYNGPAVQTYNAMHLSASSDGWAVGNAGAIARWNGTTWSSFTTPTANILYGIGGSASNDVWASGAAGTIVRWNGTSWATSASGVASILYDIDCISSSNCRAVGAGGVIRLWNGAIWAAETSPTVEDIRSIDYFSATDIWAVGASGTILHSDGTTWSLFVDTGAQTWNSLSMISSTDGWIVGSAGAMYRWNGVLWNAVIGPTANALNAVSCSNSALCWSVGAAGTIIKWNGIIWAIVTSPTANALNGVAPDGSTHALAVGATATFIEYRNSYAASATWTSQVVDGGNVGTVWNSIAWDSTVPSSTGLTIATRSGPNPTCCTGWSAYSAELTTPGGSTITSPANRYFQYRATFTSANLVSTASLDEVRISRESVTSQTLNGVQGITANDVWAVGESGVILHWTGAAWATVSSPVSVTLRDVDARTVSDAWAVGSTGTIIRWNGTTWAVVTSSTLEDLFGIEIVSASDAWAVGTLGTIVRWNGTTWAASTSGTTADLKAVSMITASNGFAVGAGGVIRRWNGATWAASTSPTAVNLNDVHCLDASNCWAVGDSGVIIKWNGAAWSTATSPIVSRLNAVEWRSATEAWAVGDNGAIITYDGVVWASVTSPTSRSLYDLTAFTPTDGWAVGAFAEILIDPPVYLSGGTFLSSILDTDAGTASWDSMFFNATLPPSTSTTVSFRSGNVAIPDGTWTAWASEQTPAGTSIPVAAARYLQYRATLSTSDTSFTPTFDDITVTYRK